MITMNCMSGWLNFLDIPILLLHSWKKDSITKIDMKNFTMEGKGKPSVRTTSTVPLKSLSPEPGAKKPKKGLLWIKKSSRPIISQPLDFRHLIHVEQDPVSKEFTGLPAGWLDQLQSQNSENNSLTLFIAKLNEMIEERGTHHHHQPKYKCLEQLGKGGTSVVYKALEVSASKEVAIKTIHIPSHPQMELIIDELFVNQISVGHPNIVRYMDSVLVRDELWLVMEHIQGGTLAELVVGCCCIDENQMATICGEVLKALSFLHFRHIIHRDVKSDNILISLDGSVKLCDFGYVARMSSGHDKRNTLVGTLPWMAPELLYGLEYGISVDIWALGIVIIEMYSGTLPVIQPNFRPEITDKWRLSRVLQNFLDGCLEVVATNRPSSSDLLHHKFIMAARPVSYLIPLTALFQKHKG